jgi:hypothetical protein
LSRLRVRQHALEGQLKEQVAVCEQLRVQLSEAINCAPVQEDFQECPWATAEAALAACEIPPWASEDGMPWIASLSPVEPGPVRGPGAVQPVPALVRKQVEYYLSDQNLGGDTFFREKIESSPQGWLELSHILACNKMQLMQATRFDVLKALQGSHLETKVDGDFAFVRRKGDAALPAPRARRCPDDTVGASCVAPKIKLCKFFVDTGACRAGVECRFAHGRRDLAKPVRRRSGTGAFSTSKVVVQVAASPLRGPPSEPLTVMCSVKVHRDMIRRGQVLGHHTVRDATFFTDFVLSGALVATEESLEAFELQHAPVEELFGDALSASAPKPGIFEDQESGQARGAFVASCLRRLRHSDTPGEEVLADLLRLSAPRSPRVLSAIAECESAIRERTWFADFEARGFAPRISPAYANLSEAVCGADPELLESAIEAAREAGYPDDHELMERARGKLVRLRLIAGMRS